MLSAFDHDVERVVRQSIFPEAELERERQVILHEYTEEEDDALSVLVGRYGRLPRMAGIAAINPAQLREAFARMLGAGAAVALTGKIANGVEERVARLVARRCS